MGNKAMFGRALTGFSEALRPVAMHKMQEKAARAKEERMLEVRKGDIAADKEFKLSQEEKKQAYTEKQTAKKQEYQTSERVASEEARAAEGTKDRTLREKLSSRKTVKEEKPIIKVVKDEDGVSRVMSIQGDQMKELKTPEEQGAAFRDQAKTQAEEEAEKMNEKFTPLKTDEEVFGGKSQGQWTVDRTNELEQKLRGQTSSAKPAEKTAKSIVPQRALDILQEAKDGGDKTRYEFVKEKFLARGWTLPEGF